VHVFLRREANRGAFSTVLQKGADEAGAIYIVENPLDATLNLFGPAPQALIDNENDDRQFEQVLESVTQTEIDTYLEKQKNFDPDIWIVETECRTGPPAFS
jgi:hypothetical protein